jgi:hypothetical protein
MIAFHCVSGPGNKYVIVINLDNCMEWHLVSMYTPLEFVHYALPLFKSIFKHCKFQQVYMDSGITTISVTIIGCKLIHAQPFHYMVSEFH